MASSLCFNQSQAGSLCHFLIRKKIIAHLHQRLGLQGVNSEIRYQWSGLRQATKQMKRNFKRIAKILLGLLAALVLVGAFVSWRSHAKVEAALSAIRDTGAPVSLADLEPDLVPVEDNAATYLTPVIADANKLAIELYPIANADDFTWRNGLSESQIQQCAKALDAYPQVASAIERASQCKHLNWELDYRVAPSQFSGKIIESIQNLRSFARVQVCRAHWLAATEVPDAAAILLLQELRLIRLHDETPTLMAALVNTAMRREMCDQLNGLLQTSDVAPETHQAIEKELAEHDSSDRVTQMLKTERAFGIESFREFPWFVGTNDQLVYYLDFMTKQIGLSSKLPFERPAVTTVEVSGMTELIASSLNTCLGAMDNTRTKLRCLRILNAIHAQGKKVAGVSIANIGLPNESTIDPYSGKPLIVKSTDAGWQVYSVGPNGKDDGGQSLHDATTEASKDIGVGPH